MGNDRGLASPMRPCRLRCEYRCNPVGLHEPRPRLTWAHEGAGRNWCQSAYQILVASGEGLLLEDQPDVWDSGRVASPDSLNVPYAGPPLVSARRYFWKARVWDAEGRRGSDSETAFWEMGLLEPAEWRGRWIMAPDPLSAEGMPVESGGVPLGKWIWSPVLTRVYFRKTFEVDPQTTRRATLVLECECRYAVFLNGRELVPEADQGSGGQVRQYDLTPHLRERRNALAVRALQTHSPRWFASALRAGLRVESRAGPDAFHPSDSSWLMPPPFEWHPTMDDPAHPFSLYERGAAWMQPGFDDGEWQAPGICQDWHPRVTRRSHYFRKSFSLEVLPRQARVYATARGFYQLYVNGRRIGWDLLRPGRTERVQHYQVHDVTDCLRPGLNVVGMLLGSGWRNGFAGQDLGCRKPQFLLMLRTDDASGTAVHVASDESWRAHPSPYLEDALTFGVRYDAREEIEGWCTVQTDDSTWAHAAAAGSSTEECPLVGQPFPLVEVTEQLAPRSIARRGPGHFLADFGQNAAGRCRLVVHHATPGQEIVLRCAEDLTADGQLRLDPYRDVIFFDDHEEDKSPGALRNMDVYWCKGEAVEVFEPDFTYTGFRFAEVHNYPGELDPGDLTHRVFHTAAPAAGHFACSHDLLNRLWSAVVWSLRGNLHSGPTDCPTREKAYWDGDFQAFASTAFWSLDLAALISHWTVYGPKVESGDALGWAGWADERIITPWTLYCHYGDRRVLESMWPKMIALVEARAAHAPEGLYCSPKFEWGDHLALEATPKDVFCSLFHFRCVSLLARIAGILGRETEATRYAAQAEAMRAAFRRKHLEEPGFYENATQTALLLPIGFELVRPGEAHYQRLVEALLAALQRRDWHPTTGFHGTPFLLPVLSEAGHHEEAFRIATQVSAPSWGGMLAQGATTVWEGWTKYLDPRSTQSQNHYALGSIGRWFFEYLAGLRPDPEHPGFTRFHYRPMPVSGLDWAEATYESQQGRIEGGWRRTKGGGCIYRLAVPPNVEALVALPALPGQELSESGASIQSRGIKTERRDSRQLCAQVGSGVFEFVVK